MKGISTIALGAVDAVLLLVLVALWVGGGSRWFPPAAVAPDLTVPGNGLASVALGNYQETLERPLFSPNRRPPPVVAEKTEEPAVDPFKDVRLYGLFDSGGVGGAIVSIGGAKPKRVHFGEKIGDWTLRAIDGRSLVLIRDAETRTLRLAYAVAGQPVTPSSATVPKPAAAPAVPTAASPAVGAGSNAASAAISKSASGTEQKPDASAKPRAAFGPPPVQPAVKPAPGAAAAPPSSSVSQSAEELARDRLAQRAERRAQHGLPLTAQ